MMLLPLMAGLVVSLLALLYLRPPKCGALGRWFHSSIKKLARTQVGRNMDTYFLLVSGVVKLCLGYVQCLGAIARFPLVSWPPAFRSFIDAFEYLNLEIFSIIPAECITNSRLGFFLELVASLIAPVVCLLVLGMLVWLADCIDLMTGLRGRLVARQAYLHMLWRNLHSPKCYKLFTWTMLILYPTIARKSLAVFDCLPAGVDSTNHELFLLRDDPVIECYKDQWRRWAVLSACSILIYCLGLPLLAFCAAWKFHSSAQDNLAQRERVALIVGACTCPRCPDACMHFRRLMQMLPPFHRRG